MRFKIKTYLRHELPEALRAKYDAEIDLWADKYFREKEKNFYPKKIYSDEAREYWEANAILMRIEWCSHQKRFKLMKSHLSQEKELHTLRNYLCDFQDNPPVLNQDELFEIETCLTTSINYLARRLGQIESKKKFLKKRTQKNQYRPL